jgi:hypothetical protein
MPSIAEILAHKNVLIREATALTRLNLRNCQVSREWLRKRLPYSVAMLPRQQYLYQIGLVDQLRRELDQLAKLAPPANTHACPALSAAPRRTN